MNKPRGLFDDPVAAVATPVGVEAPPIPMQTGALVLRSIADLPAPIRTRSEIPKIGADVIDEGSRIDGAIQAKIIAITGRKQAVTEAGIRLRAAATGTSGNTAKGLSSFFSWGKEKAKDTKEALLAQWTSFTGVVDTCTPIFAQAKAAQDAIIPEIDTLIVENGSAYQKLGRIIESATAELDQMRQQVAALKEAAPTDLMVVNEIQDRDAAARELQTKIAGLDSFRTFLVQTTASARMCQEASRGLSDVLESLEHEVGAMMKKVLTLRLIAEDQKEIAKMAAETRKVVNDLSREATALIGQNAAEIADLSTTPTLTTETLQENQKVILAAMDKVDAVYAANDAKFISDMAERDRLRREMVSRHLGVKTPPQITAK